VWRWTGGCQAHALLPNEATGCFTQRVFARSGSAI